MKNRIIIAPSHQICLPLCHLHTLLASRPTNHLQTPDFLQVLHSPLEVPTTHRPTSRHKTLSPPTISARSPTHNHRLASRPSSLERRLSQLFLHNHSHSKRHRIPSLDKHLPPFQLRATYLRHRLQDLFASRQSHLNIQTWLADERRERLRTLILITIQATLRREHLYPRQ